MDEDAIKALPKIKRIEYADVVVIKFWKFHDCFARPMDVNCCVVMLQQLQDAIFFESMLSGALPSISSF